MKGSHIVVPRLYEGDHAFILQNDDRRVIFIYSYEERYTLIGTTDVEMTGDAAAAAARAPAEIAYLCRAVNRYFERQTTERDVVWSYCGVRPLFDDGSADPSAITRDYVLRLDAAAGRRAGALGVRRQDHHLSRGSPSTRSRSSRRGLPACARRGPPASPCPAAIWAA